MYEPEGDFSEEEKISFLSTLTGIFPLHKIVPESLIQKLDEKLIPPISEFDVDLQVAWFVPRKLIKKKTKHGKEYWIVEVIDGNNQITKIKCWGVKEQDVIYLNRPYMSRLDYDEQWGFSTRSIRYNFKLLG